MPLTQEDLNQYRASTFRTLPGQLPLPAMLIYESILREGPLNTIDLLVSL